MDISSANSLTLKDVREALPTNGNNVSTHGEFARHTVTTVGQKLLIPAKKKLSLFTCLQQRTIDGRGAGKGADCLHFLANLVRKQLLMPSELEMLGRAVVQGDCIIEPQLCRSPQGINTLRILSAFLKHLQKSPEIKMALEQLIDESSVMIGGDSFNFKKLGPWIQDYDRYHQYSAANIRSLQSELVSVLKKYHTTIHFLPGISDEKRCQFLKDLLNPLINNKAFLHVLDQLPTDLQDSEDSKLLYSDLQNLVDNLECAIRDIDDFEGRIDQIPITRVLAFNGEFSQDAVLDGYMRKLSNDSSSLIHKPLTELLNCRFIVDHQYAVRMQWKRVIEKCINHRECAFNRSVKDSARCVWIYFRGVHLEFDYNFHQSCFIKQSVFHNDIHLPILKDGAFRGHLRYSGLVSYSWLVGLYLELHKWLESPPVADKAGAFAFVNKIWDCEYSALDDFQWLISVIARSGLAPYGEKDCYESISMLCPYCEFDGQVRRRDLIKGAAPYVHQLHAQFLALVQNHRKIRRCSAAQSVEPDRLRDERHHLTRFASVQGQDTAELEN